MSTEPRAPRKRGEARQAILDTARELFAANGYQGTSIRDIAKAADVSETLIFRNFETKDRLFDQAITQPFQSFVDGFLDRWKQLEEPRSNPEMVSMFVAELHAFVVEHRDILFTLIVANRFGLSADNSAASITTLRDQIGKLVDFTAGEAAWRGFEHLDLEKTVTFTIALVLAVGLLEDTLFAPHDHDPDQRHLLGELAAYAIGGIVRAHDN